MPDELQSPPTVSELMTKCVHKFEEQNSSHTHFLRFWEGVTQDDKRSVGSYIIEALEKDGYCIRKHGYVGAVTSS